MLGSFFYGKHIGNELADAQRLRDEALAHLVAEAAQKGAASATVKVDLIQKTIQTKAKEIVRVETQYRDCVNDPIVVGLLDAARANRSPDADRTSKLPAGTSADQPRNVR